MLGWESATGILTLACSCFFGEITPKTMATDLCRKNLRSSYAPVIYWTYESINAGNFFGQQTFQWRFCVCSGIDPDGKNRTMTEQELRTIVDVSHEDGVIEKEEKQMIYNVFDFGDSRAKDVMVPRIDMSFIDVERNL